MNTFPGVAIKTSDGLSAGLGLFAEIAGGFNLGKGGVDGHAIYRGNEGQRTSSEMSSSWRNQR
jgi:hypothetical protein